MRLFSLRHFVGGLDTFRAPPGVGAPPVLMLHALEGDENDPVARYGYFRLHLLLARSVNIRQSFASGGEVLTVDARNNVGASAWRPIRILLSINAE